MHLGKNVGLLQRFLLLSFRKLYFIQFLDKICMEKVLQELFGSIFWASIQFKWYQNTFGCSTAIIYLFVKLNSGVVAGLFLWHVPLVIQTSLIFSNICLKTAKTSDLVNNFHTLKFDFVATKIFIATKHCMLMVNTIDKFYIFLNILFVLFNSRFYNMLFFLSQQAIKLGHF